MGTHGSITQTLSHLFLETHIEICITKAALFELRQQQMFTVITVNAIIMLTSFQMIQCKSFQLKTFLGVTHSSLNARHKLNVISMQRAV